MRRCALSSPPKTLTGHSPPQCIWAVQMHSLTGHLKPTARSSHREVEYELYYGSTMPICASISARALGEKSPVIVVMVSSLTKYSRCLYGNEIIAPVGGIIGRSGR